mmetsp:Transcript_42087/g.116273  ORF Transcript_42087/g.116273 Transcript_42087/m.116273 type:complete len:496 (+) Transcript_42087:63-1550(+)
MAASNADATMAVDSLRADAAERVHCGGRPPSKRSCSRIISTLAIAVAFVIAMVVAILRVRIALSTTPGHVRRTNFRVLILTSSTGGGHNAAAAAIRCGIEALSDKAEVLIVDLMKDHTPWPFRAFPALYEWLEEHPNMWRMTYFGSQYGAGQMMTTLAWMIARPAWAVFETKRPHVIVSVHPMLQHSPIELMRYNSLAPCSSEDLALPQESASSQGKIVPRRRCLPFVTVVTDMETATNLWFHPAVTRVVVPSPALGAQALRRGLQEEQILHTESLLVHPDFGNVRRLDQRRLREELGLGVDRRTVMLMGGGTGDARLAAFAHALRRVLPADAAQLVVLCGRNNALRAQLQREFRGSVRGRAGVPVHVLDFRRDVPRWMRAADVLVTKAGPSTIAEALAVTLPVLLFGFLPGQERGNVAYVQRAGVGDYAPRPVQAARKVYSWLFGNDGALELMRFRAAEQSHGLEATDMIAKLITELALLQRTREVPEKAVFAP